MVLRDALAPVHQRAKGAGRLAVKRSGDRTRIDTLFQEGCGKIRMPDSFDASLEAVLINTSGGLTGGDRMTWEIEAGADTDLVVTTQACEKIYKASSGVAEVETQLRVGDGAKLAWLPQETILYDNGHLTRRLDVDLAKDAEFVGVEAVILGRTAMGEAVERGLFRDRWRVRREGRLLHAEEMRLDGDLSALTAVGAVLGGDIAFATLIYCGAYADAHLPKIRALVEKAGGGASHWDGKLLVRMTAKDGFELRKLLIPVISVLRNGASVPKVWTL
ncbi:urease accessory protein UreD [Rhizobium sp. L1K21]|uniref:urease accessory protein UreD n=1 Tax=Rhizobium sp. L1K21 TaxID=2954933 RepID=UPI0020925629|nr:urease accessory protein UreD [Rhizobium sp. L1K21]MCO6185316.1 urease accessory protein UreD [Rhizobium sp. L1K21]